MNEERQLVEVIGQLYEVAGAPDGVADFSKILAPHFGTASSIVHTCTESGLEMRALLSATENFDNWAGSAYATHYHDRNVWFQRGIRKGPSVVVICEELVPHRELLRSEWYDYCQKLDWFHCLGIGVKIADDLVGGIGFHRPRHARAFDEADRRRAQFLLPHIERGLQLHHRITRLTGERDAALSVLDGLSIGILFVGANGRLLFANSVAERVLRGGKALMVSRGHLRAVDRDQQGALDRLIGEAAETSGGKGIANGGILPLSREAGPPLTVLVSPFRSETLGYGPAQPAAVIIFADPDNQKPVAERALMQAYGLTKAEARLLSALLAGQGLAEYADKVGISINTAKTQMRQIFWKTGHERQVDLVRTIMTDSAMRLFPRGESEQADLGEGRDER